VKTKEVVRVVIVLGVQLIIQTHLYVVLLKVGRRFAPSVIFLTRQKYVLNVKKIAIVTVFLQTGANVVNPLGMFAPNVSPTKIAVTTKRALPMGCASAILFHWTIFHWTIFHMRHMCKRALILEDILQELAQF